MLSRRRLVFEKYYYDQPMPYKIEIHKINKKQDSHALFWKEVLLMLALFALFAIFIASVFLLKWRRPGLYLEDCIQRSCSNNFELKCINSTCHCPSSDFYYTNKCLSKKSYGEYCQNSQEQCKKGLICFNGKCSCIQKQFWTGIKCSNRGSYGENCDFIKCLDSLFLICDPISRICICDSTRFWSGRACYKQRLFNEICGSVFTACRTDLGLICLNGFCKTLTHAFVYYLTSYFILNR
jgi:hypothetical protein